MVLELSDEADPIDIAAVIFRHIFSLFARLGQESFTNIKMNCLFGDSGVLDQFPYLQKVSRSGHIFIEYYYMIRIKVKRNLTG